MISYQKDLYGDEITHEYLKKRVENHKANWLAKAAKRTDNYRIAGKVTDSKHIWSQIKEVFMELQGNKCAFCERELEGVAYGKGSIDIEHFRPKNNLRKWKGSEGFNHLNIPITKPKVNGGGYYLLTYNLMNYTIACGPCNQAIKSDVFPVCGDYNTLMEDPVAEGQEEKPLLLYPIGTVDANCEDLIYFDGAMPCAKNSEGIAFHRAISTIEFFSLHNADARGILFKERCTIILQIAAFTDGEDAQDYETVLGNLLSDKASHANCARSYLRLVREDPAKAELVLKEAKDFIRSYIAL